MISFGKFCMISACGDELNAGQMQTRTKKVKANRVGANVMQAVKITDKSKIKIPLGLVTYSVVEPSADCRSSADRRDGSRHRTRLRSAKIVDLEHHFVIECLVHDRSSTGARLRLIEETAVPDCFRVYDDERETFVTARIAWRQGRNLGVRFVPGQARHRLINARAVAACKRFYAVSR